jgi:hypothetical protein
MRLTIALSEQHSHPYTQQEEVETMSTQQGGAPRNYTTQARRTTTGMATKGQHAPDETIYVPPLSMFLLGFGGMLVAICATIWQVFTSFTAFFTMFEEGHNFQAMKPVDRLGAQPLISVVCVLIAVSFQFAILFLVFRIEREWKDSKAKTSSGVDAAKNTAVEVVQHVPLVLVWGVLGFIADTVGDYTFLNLYTNNWFLLFMYGCALYASSTIMFARSIEYLWAGFVALEKWKAFKANLQHHATSGSQTP